MVKPSISIKVGSVALIMTLTLLYGLYTKRSIESVLTDGSSLVLKDMPRFSLESFSDSKKEVITDHSLFRSSDRLGFVHFWATWCAPCEAELPDFISLVRKYEKSGVRALLIAVQDDVNKMKKYLKKFKDLPSNIDIVHDKTGELMSRFGTVKIPETYLFDRNNKNLNKYVGPQDWSQKRFSDRIDFYLLSLKMDPIKSKNYPIESH